MEKVDIYKIIDDAIEKKDRSVTIFITGDNMSVYVNPLEESPKWIRTDIGCCKCSICGSSSDYETPYCPECGEKLKRSE